MGRFRPILRGSALPLGLNLFCVASTLERTSISYRFCMRTDTPHGTSCGTDSGKRFHWIQTLVQAGLRQTRFSDYREGFMTASARYPGIRITANGNQLVS